MNAISVVSRWFIWHYVFAWADVTRVFANFTWFSWKLFSISDLIAHLFSPFERLDEKPKSLLPEDIGSAIIVSLLMRLLGAVVRIPIIVIGIVSTSIVLILWVCAYVVWFVLPALALVSVVVGFSTLLFPTV